MTTLWLRMVVVLVTLCLVLPVMVRAVSFDATIQALGSSGTCLHANTGAIGAKVRVKWCDPADDRQRWLAQVVQGKSEPLVQVKLMSQDNLCLTLSENTQDKHVFLQPCDASDSLQHIKLSRVQAEWTKEKTGYSFQFPTLKLQDQQPRCLTSNIRKTITLYVTAEPCVESIAQTLVSPMVGLTFARLSLAKDLETVHRPAQATSHREVSTHEQQDRAGGSPPPPLSLLSKDRPRTKEELELEAVRLSLEARMKKIGSHEAHSHSRRLPPNGVRSERKDMRAKLMDLVAERAKAVNEEGLTMESKNNSDAADSIAVEGSESTLTSVSPQQQQQFKEQQQQQHSEKVKEGEKEEKRHDEAEREVPENDLNGEEFDEHARDDEDAKEYEDENLTIAFRAFDDFGWAGTLHDHFAKKGEINDIIVVKNPSFHSIKLNLNYKLSLYRDIDCTIYIDSIAGSTMNMTQYTRTLPVRCVITAPAKTGENRQFRPSDVSFCSDEYLMGSCVAVQAPRAPRHYDYALKDIVKGGFAFSVQIPAGSQAHFHFGDGEPGEILTCDTLVLSKDYTHVTVSRVGWETLGGAMICPLPSFEGNCQYLKPQTYDVNDLLDPHDTVRSVYFPDEGYSAAFINAEGRQLHITSTNITDTQRLKFIEFDQAQTIKVSLRCKDRCSGHGKCIGPNICECAEGWSGEFCNFGPPDSTSIITCTKNAMLVGEVLQCNIVPRRGGEATSTTSDNFNVVSNTGEAVTISPLTPKGKVATRFTFKVTANTPVLPARALVNVSALTSNLNVTHTCVSPQVAVVTPWTAPNTSLEVDCSLQAAYRHRQVQHHTCTLVPLTNGFTHPTLESTVLCQSNTPGVLYKAVSLPTASPTSIVSVFTFELHVNLSQVTSITKQQSAPSSPLRTISADISCATVPNGQRVSAASAGRSKLSFSPVHATVDLESPLHTSIVQQHIQAMHTSSSVQTQANSNGGKSTQDSSAHHQTDPQSSSSTSTSPNNHAHFLQLDPIFARMDSYQFSDALVLAQHYLDEFYRDLGVNPLQLGTVHEVSANAENGMDDKGLDEVCLKETRDGVASDCDALAREEADLPAQGQGFVTTSSTLLQGWLNKFRAYTGSVLGNTEQDEDSHRADTVVSGSSLPKQKAGHGKVYNSTVIQQLDTELRQHAVLLHTLVLRLNLVLGRFQPALDSLYLISNATDNLRGDKAPANADGSSDASRVVGDSSSADVEKMLQLNTQFDEAVEASNCTLGVSIADRLLQVGKAMWTPRIFRIKCNIQKGDYRAISGDVKALLLISPKNCEALLLLARAQWAVANKIAPAIQTLAKCLKWTSPSDPERKQCREELQTIKKVSGLLKSGNRYKDVEYFDDAIEFYEDLLKLDGTSLMALSAMTSLCELYFAVQDPVASIRVCSMALKHRLLQEEDPAMVQLLMFRSWSYMHQELYSEALKDVKTARRIAPNDVKLLSLHNQIEQAVKSATQKDYYKILGVSKHASSNRIRKAYRQLVKVWHPDKAHDDPNAEQIFLDIVEAYEVLMDPELREVYDKGINLEDFMEQRQRKREKNEGEQAKARREQRNKAKERGEQEPDLAKQAENERNIQIKLPKHCCLPFKSDE
eukprot:m.231975 g.231975  ORF g.231975 m.231975 type:complete len:1609 (+) comp15229_c0_seq6:101-4927(+)